MQVLKHIAIYIILLMPVFLLSQGISSDLDKRITVKVNNLTIADAFKIINAKSGLQFSYSSQFFDDAQKVSLEFYNTPIRIVLDEIFKDKVCAYKLRKKYIIIYPLSKLNPDKYITISGYVFQSRDSFPIEHTSIYVKQTRAVVLSNAEGYFILKFPKPKSSESFNINFAKENYSDTAIRWNGNEDMKLNVSLFSKRPVSLNDFFKYDSVPTLASSMTVQKLDFKAMRYKKGDFIKNLLGVNQLSQNFKNINETFFTNFSVSLVPYLSTNKLLAVNTENKVSLNVLIGYSKGTRALELGGLMNIVAGSSKYAQMAGLGNIVKDSVHGFQAAGLFNTSRNIDGIQAAGLFNTVNRHVKGAQMAGIFNIGESVQGFQAGGIFNKTKQLKGIQASGLFNISERVNGIQAAGLFNISTAVEGIQIAGLFNKSGYVKGSQISVINLTDSISGIPLGLFSFVKKGYKAIDLSFNELLMPTIGFSTGVNAFHNKLFLGVGFNQPFVGIGYGLGSHLRLGKNWYFSPEWQTQILHPYRLNIFSANSMQTLLLGCSYRIKNRCNVLLGPSLNWWIINTDRAEYVNSINAIVPKVLHQNLDNASKTQQLLWLGFKCSIQLLKKY
jgi:hypothetical protein